MSRIIADEENVARWRDAVNYTLQDYLDYKRRDLFGMVECWDQIELEIRRQIDWQDNTERSAFFPDHDIFARFMFHHEWNALALIDNICNIPLDVEDRRAILHVINGMMRVHVRSKLETRATVTYQKAYDYIIDSTARREWIEAKYQRANSSKVLKLLIYQRAKESVDSGHVYLMALDHVTLEKINRGDYDGCSLAEFEKLGDYIAREYYIVLSNFSRQWYDAVPSLIDSGLSNGKLYEGWVQSLFQARTLSRNNLFGESGSIDRYDIINSKGDADEIKRLIDVYVKEHPGQPVSEIAFKAFTDLLERGALGTGTPDEASSRIAAVNVRPSLPQSAPEPYGGLRGPEAPPEFVKRVYGEWLGHGLTRAHIRNLDPTLYKAIENWSRKPGNEWPADVDMPKKSEQVSRELDALHAQAPDGRLGSVIGHFAAREAQRIRSASRRRDEQGK